jgi:chemotaxis protein methyltransferase CheR
VAGVTVYRKADGSPIQRVGSGLWPRASDPTEGGISEEGIATATPARALTSFSTLDDKSIRPGELPAHAEAIKEADSIHAASSPQATAPDTPPGALVGIDLEKIRQHASTGDWSAAADACEQALRRHPLDAAVYFTYALISEHIGAVAATEQALGRAIYLDRNFALAHYHLGRFRAARGLRKAASRSLANALKIVAGHHDKEVLAMGEGLTVAELRELTRIQLDLLEER